MKWLAAVYLTDPTPSVLTTLRLFRYHLRSLGTKAEDSEKAIRLLREALQREETQQRDALDALAEAVESTR